MLTTINSLIFSWHDDNMAGVWDARAYQHHVLLFSRLTGVKTIHYVKPYGDGKPSMVLFLFDPWQ